MTFNIVKHAGRIMEGTFPDGMKVYRHDKVLFQIGEQIMLIDCLNEDEHFIFQWRKPLNKEEYNRIKQKYGYMPKELLGDSALCSCGSSAVLCLSSPYPNDEKLNKICCKSLLQFGFHQTSFQIKDGRLILNRQQQENLLLDPSEVEKSMRSDQDR